MATPPIVVPPVVVPPVITLAPLVVAGVGEIDFSGKVTGLAPGQTIEIDVSFGPGVIGSAKGTATTLAAPPPPPALVPFDPAGTPFVLSVDKLTATLSAAAPAKGGALVGLGKKTGKWTGAFEVMKVGPNFAVGLASAAYVLGFDYLGNAAVSSSLALYSCGTGNTLTIWLHNNIAQGPPMGTFAPDVDGAIIQWAWDADDDLWWVTSPAMRTAVGPNAWNDQPNADPVAKIGGISTAWRGGATLWAALGLGDQGTSGVIVPPPLTLTGYSVLDA